MKKPCKKLAFSGSVRAGAIIGLMLGLAACSTVGNIIIPRKIVCPPTAVVAGTGSYTLFRPGPGRDVEDVKFDAEISKVRVRCRYRGRGAAVTISFEVAGTLGPAADTSVYRVPFFVAVSRDNEAVLGKRVFVSEHRFSAGVDHSVQREELVQFIPLEKNQKPTAFEILIGFQLTPEQLEYNAFR